MSSQTTMARAQSTASCWKPLASVSTNRLISITSANGERLTTYAIQARHVQPHHLGERRGGTQGVAGGSGHHCRLRPVGAGRSRRFQAGPGVSGRRQPHRTHRPRNSGSGSLSQPVFRIPAAIALIDRATAFWYGSGSEGFAHAAQQAELDRVEGVQVGFAAAQ